MKYNKADKRQSGHQNSVFNKVLFKSFHVFRIQQKKGECQNKELLYWVKLRGLGVGVFVGFACRPPGFCDVVGVGEDGALVAVGTPGVFVGETAAVGEVSGVGLGTLVAVGTSVGVGVVLSC
jgi:hypothetical protein